MLFLLASCVDKRLYNIIYKNAVKYNSSNAFVRLHSLGWFGVVLTAVDISLVVMEASQWVHFKRGITKNQTMNVSFYIYYVSYVIANVIIASQGAFKTVDTHREEVRYISLAQIIESSVLNCIRPSRLF